MTQVPQKSVMSGKMYRKLKLGPLDDSNLPSVVGANGSSLGVLGRIRCTIAFEKDEDKFNQTFLVCENLQRGVILGKDFARQNCAGVYWTPHNTRVLHTNLKTIAETNELVPSGTAAIHVKQTTKLPPRSLAVVDVNINTTSEDKIRTIPDQFVPIKTPQHVHDGLRCRFIHTLERNGYSGTIRSNQSESHRERKAQKRHSGRLDTKRRRRR